MEEASVIPEAEEIDLPAPAPITRETALSWLATTTSTAVLALLRAPEFAPISMSAFVGFRVNATSFNNPLVRSRLAQEITQNDIFAQRIRALAEQNKEAASPPPAPIKPLPAEAKAIPHREEELKAERNRRRQERDEARQALQRAEQALRQSEQARAQADKTQEEQARLVQQQQHRIARLERQLSQMQAEQVSLLKALRSSKAPAAAQASPAPAPEATPPETSEAAWIEAVRHLLHKGRHETALSLTLDVLRSTPHDAIALEIAAQAYEQREMPQQASSLLRHLLEIQTAQLQIKEAAETMVRLIIIQASPEEAARDVKNWVGHLRRIEEDHLSVARPALERLRAQAPASHAWLAAYLSAATPRLASVLIPAPGALGPDDPLPLPQPWTARRLIQAVNANEEGLVAKAQEALTQESASSQRIWEALEQAASHDNSSLIPLRRIPRGPVVVDGSNVAWYDQSSYSHPQARLRPLLEVRRALRRRGYFPVLLFGDAPLPYTIDEPETLRAMLAQKEIELVDSGVDADEVLLREAKRRQAPLVTNDHMKDWDPNDEVEKIPYSVSATGEALLLTSLK